MKFGKLRKTVCLLFCLLFTATMYAEITPRWVTKGANELDKMRSNRTYRFQVFHTYDADKKTMEVNRYRPLLDYVLATYGGSKADVDLEIRPSADGKTPATCIITFVRNGQPAVVYAQMVDDFVKFEDYANGSFEYNLYQLYAISEPNVEPRFDSFEVTRRYDGVPAAMSLVPGLGQIYKGQKAKGYSFLGTEIALAGSIVFATTQMHKNDDLANKNPGVADSYQSKVTTFRQFRTFCAVAGAGLYVYNVFDALFVKGARRVTVKRKDAPNLELSFEPTAAPDMTGVGIKLKF